MQYVAKQKTIWEDVDANKLPALFIPKLTDGFDSNYINECKTTDDIDKEHKNRAALNGYVNVRSKDQAYKAFEGF